MFRRPSNTFAAVAALTLLVASSTAALAVTRLLVPDTSVPPSGIRPVLDPGTKTPSTTTTTSKALTTTTATSKGGTLTMPGFPPTSIPPGKPKPNYNNPQVVIDKFKSFPPKAYICERNHPRGCFQSYVIPDGNGGNITLDLQFTGLHGQLLPREKARLDAALAAAEARYTAWADPKGVKGGNIPQNGPPKKQQ